MIKKLFCDLETSGLDPKKNGVLTIGGIIEYGGIYEEFELKSKPFSEDEIDMAALAVNKITIEELGTFPEPREMYHQLMSHISSHVNRYDKKDKLFFIAHNGIRFDEPFLREFFNKNGNNYFGSYFFYPPICTMAMASLYLMPIRHKMEQFRLHNIAEKVGIEVDEAVRHTALGDTKLMRKLYYVLQEKMDYQEYV